MFRTIWSWLTFTTISCTVFAAYFAFTVYQFYIIMNPQFIDVTGPTVNPLWEEGQRLYAECYLSPRERWDANDFSNPRVLFIGNFTDLTFDWADNERSMDLNISKRSLAEFAAANDAASEHEADAAVRDMWTSLRKNGTVYLHVHVTKEGASSNPNMPNYDYLKAVHQSNPLVRYAPRQNVKNATYLLAKHFPSLDDPPLPEEPLDEDDEVETGLDPALTESVVAYWKPQMAIRLVTDFKRYPYQEIPPLVYNSMRFEQIDKVYYYVPSMYLDEMGMTAEKLVPLNRTIRSLPIKITYEPMSYARWQILLTMEMALKSQESMGFGAQDLDSMRSMIADTNPYLLAVTMTVSLLHILFDWLAFKNDISYWRQKKDDMVGISLRSMIISFVSQFVIFLYLLEEKGSLLISVPQGISCVLLVWKVGKVYRANSKSKSKALKKTSQADEMATNHMMYVLVPLMIGYSAYSLLFKQHLSWYGWVLGSLTGTVYAFGFIMMTPQLVINYQLKSVAHLQWRYLIYRALNTFIDDLFAFIITMPTMHRLSCFRDDIIFFIYIYQRWIYPVDQNRKFDEDEGEGSIEAIDPTASKKDD